VGNVVEAEKLDQIWEADRLDRRQDARFLYNFIVGEVAKRKRLNRRSSYSLNIDAEWGGGKSFFLERFGKQAKERGHVVAYVNAWQDDHAGDPYIAIMAAIDQAFAPYVKKDSAIETAWKSVKSNGGRIALKAGAGAVRSLVKKHFDLTTDDILGEDLEPSLASEAMEELIDKSIKTGAAEIEKLFDRTLQAMIDQFQKADKAIQSFREKLAAAVETLDKSGKKAPLFVLIDELDRCRPSYAVQLLERIKHLFEVDGVAFIFATNSQQLQYSIAGAYGPGFDGFMYVKRFFDRTYLFDTPSDQRRIEELCRNIDPAKVIVPGGNLSEFVASGCRHFRLDLRATEHVIDIIDVTVSAWPHRIKLDLALLFPLCTTFYKTGRAEWNAVDATALDDWVIGSVVSDGFRGEIDRRINLKFTFETSRNIFSNLGNILEHLQNLNNRDQNDRYIDNVFSQELNGPVQRDQPSVQTELTRLVKNAGMLLTLEK
jgi:hypothetical protein